MKWAEQVQDRLKCRPRLYQRCSAIEEEEEEEEEEKDDDEEEEEEKEEEEKEEVEKEEEEEKDDDEEEEKEEEEKEEEEEEEKEEEEKKEERKENEEGKEEEEGVDDDIKMDIEGKRCDICVVIWLKNGHPRDRCLIPGDCKKNVYSPKHANSLLAWSFLFRANCKILLPPVRLSGRVEVKKVWRHTYTSPHACVRTNLSSGRGKYWFRSAGSGSEYGKYRE
jgi:hypothetical protein